MARSGRHRGVRPASSSLADNVLTRRANLTPGVVSVVFSPAIVNVTVGGMAAFYSVEMRCSNPPEQSVTVAPVNLPTGLRVLPAMHTFTAENWSKPQYFRVAAANGAVYDELRGGGAVIEHTTSSLEARFHGRRVIHMPGAVQAQICPRDGNCLFATGNTEAMQTTQQQNQARQPATIHEFTEIELRRSALGACPLVARCSVLLPTAAGVVAAVAAVEAANNAATHAAGLKLRRRLSAAAIAIPDVVEPTITDEPATAARAAIDHKNTLVKLTSRGNRLLALYNDGEIVSLGSSERSSVAKTFSRRENGENGTDVAVSRMLLDVASGDGHMAAASEQGYLLTWGDVRVCRRNKGAPSATATPETPATHPRIVQSLLHKCIVQVSCGSSHSFALAEDGGVFSWGLGRSGALGHGLNDHEQTFDTVPSPMEVLSLKGRRVAQVACGDMHSAVLLACGTLLTCGQREHGRLGRPVLRGTIACDEEENSSWFAPVGFPQEGTRCTFVTCGTAHTLAIGGPHELFAFGWNASGQLGVGDCRDRYVPTRVTYFGQVTASHGTALDIASVAAGKMHSLASSADGRLFAWGNDEIGQCGVSSCPQIYTLPHLVTSLVGLRVTQIAAGEAHSAVLTSLGQRQLEALERTQPAQYAQLVKHYERAVKDDSQRRALVLERVRRQQLERAAAARRRRPTIDPATSALTKMLVLQSLVDQDTALDEMRLQTRRPQTTRMVSSRRANNDNDDSLQEVVLPDKSNSQRVRCSSASMVRQARLAVLQAPLSESPVIPKGQASSATIRPKRQSLIPPSNPQQPRSAASIRQPHKHKDEALRQLAATLQSRNATLAPEAMHAEAGLFPPSRPKSAPSTAVRRR